MPGERDRGLSKRAIKMMARSGRGDHGVVNLETQDI